MLQMWCNLNSALVWHRNWYDFHPLIATLMAAFGSSMYPFSCDYWRIAVRSFFSGLCVLLLAPKGYRIHYFFTHTFKRVTTNKHSSVLCRLIGKVMDFTDSSRTEPNTSTPFVQRVNWLVWTKLCETTQRTFFFWHFGA